MAASLSLSAKLILNRENPAEIPILEKIRESAVRSSDIVIFIILYPPTPAPPIAASLILPANNIWKKPREISQFGKKSAKVYHSLYSSTEQLKVAL
jgi:hypothetical protein